MIQYFHMLLRQWAKGGGRREENAAHRFAVVAAKITTEDLIAFSFGVCLALVVLVLVQVLVAD